MINLYRMGTFSGLAFLLEKKCSISLMKEMQIEIRLLTFSNHLNNNDFVCVFLFVCLFLLFRTASTAHGSSQVRDPIGAVAAGLCNQTLVLMDAHWVC